MTLESKRRQIVEEDLPAQEKEKIYNLHLSYFVKKMFPHLIRTKVPTFITKLVSDIEPVCQFNPLNDDQTESYAIIRGSSIKRFHWGTPFGYGEVSRHFQNIYFPIREDDKLTQKVVQNLAHGPLDIDVKYKLKDRQNGQSMEVALLESLQRQGFQKVESSENSNKIVYRNKNYQAILKKKQIDKQGTVSPRIVYEVEFHKRRSNYRNRFDFLMNVSFSELAEKEQLYQDFRRTFYVPPIEALTVGYVTHQGQKRKDTRLIIHNEIKRFLHTPFGIRIAGFGSFSQSVFGFLKGSIGNEILFAASKETGLYDYVQIFKSFQQAWHTDGSFWKSRLNLLDTDDVEKMKNPVRVEDFVSNYLLLLTFDPFLFLQLGYETDAYKPTILGEVIDTREKLVQVMMHMQKQLLGHDGDYPRLIESSLPELSKEYKMRTLSNLYGTLYTGPFMLFRALKDLELLPQEYNDGAHVLSSMVNLINPLNWLQKNVPDMTTSEVV